jgi:hypothetical protein
MWLHLTCTALHPGRRRALSRCYCAAAPAADIARYIEVDIDVTTCKTAGYIVQVWLNAAA